ncbi:MAG: NUDIX domain-containing protein [Planctomycetes bacterium]|nr:NUDIX domain-containing protein [Planctomycetota bacterium]
MQPERWSEQAAYCLLCGSGLEIRTVFGTPRRACPRCEFVLFHNPPTAAAAVVTRGRDVLLVQRSIRPCRGMWCFPAGFQEHDESPAEAAVRETREETGLDVEILRLLDVFFARDVPGRRVNLVVYLARAVAGTLRPADDAAAAAFFPLDTPPAEIAFPNNRVVIERLRQQFPCGDIQ